MELSARSNPNLLINSDFRNPVNQRGQRVYKGRGYTIARWIILNSNATITVADGHLILKGSDDAGAVDYFSSPLELSADHLNGLPITLSVQLRDGTIKAVSGILTSNIAPGSAILVVNVGINGLIFYICKDVSGCVCVMFRIPANTTTDVLRCKFEFGSVCTIANDPPANYGERLALCQRYAIQLVTSIVSPLGYGLAENSTTCYITVPLPTTMRIAPTVVFNSESNLYLLKDTNIPAASIAAYGVSANSVLLKVTVPGGLIPGQMYLLHAAGVGTPNLLLDAEIY